jgi:pimeloyl-ACP methyl ester carboxylesterase
MFMLFLMCCGALLMLVESVKIPNRLSGTLKTLDNAFNPFKEFATVTYEGFNNAISSSNLRVRDIASKGYGFSDFLQAPGQVLLQELGSTFNHNMNALESTIRQSTEKLESVRKSITDVNQAELLSYAALLFLSVFISLISGSVGPFQTALVNEAIFFTYCFYLTKTDLGTVEFANPEDNVANREWEYMWKNVLTTVDDPRTWFHSWFLEGRFEDITKEDAQEFLSWAMFTTVREKVTASQLREMNVSIAQIEKACNAKFLPRPLDRAPLRKMTSTIEPLQWFHKPSLFYAVTQGLFSVKVNKDMKAEGFHIQQAGCFKYWVKDCSVTASASAGSAVGVTVGASNGFDAVRYAVIKVVSKAKGSIAEKVEPIVFFHGVGGLAAYIPLIKELSLLGRPLMVVEMPYVSLHIAPNKPSINEHVESFNTLLSDLGYSKAYVIGHSWGSNVLSWICQSPGAKDRVAGCVFLDPVVFMLHLRTVTYEWFYAGRKPEYLSGQKSPLDMKPFLEQQQKLRMLKDPTYVPENDIVGNAMGLVKTELFAVTALQRDFFWFRSVLWPSELEPLGFKTAVVVSSKDTIVPSRAVQKNIEQHRRQRKLGLQPSNVEVFCLEGAGHGGLVFETGFMKEAIGAIKTVVSRR